jgi:hypothetical protein
MGIGDAVIVVFIFVVGILAAAISNVLADEYRIGADPFARWLVRRAAARLPEKYRADYQIEWLQLIADMQSPTQKLLHGFTLLMRANAIGSELLPKTSTSNFSVRRVVDVVAVTVSAPAVLIVIMLFAVLLKLESPSQPIFFCSERVGKHARIFRLWRLRTLRADRNGSSPVVGPLGRFARKWHVDELPQLLNVLQGDMTLIGPRPGTPGEGELGTLDAPGLAPRVGPEKVLSWRVWIRTLLWRLRVGVVALLTKRLNDRD